MNGLPEVFLERLKDIIPNQHWDAVLHQFTLNNPLTVRINTLRTNKEDVLSKLDKLTIAYSEVPWYDQVLIIDSQWRENVLETDLVQEGHLYVQNLSSMLVPIILDPKPGEAVLDLCAAPGSKFTQIAALMDNQGSIVGVEAVKNRYYRLKNVVDLLGAKPTKLKMVDGRKVRMSGPLFDKILVDAPCSSEGRFNTNNKKSYAYWSRRKIKEMVRKQRGLLLNASRLLKPGGTLVYSTCTFAPEENEGVVDWVLRKAEGELSVDPVDVSSMEGYVRTYPSVLRWKKKEYNEQIKHCVRILPDENMEGFFVARMVKE